MKILTREFNQKEKAVLLVLIVVIMALCYYQFIYVPIKEQIADAENQAENLQMELTITEAKLSEMRVMKEELDTIEAEGTVSYMASYNNSKAEVAFLNDVLADTASYSVSISGVTREGDQIRRNISLQFKVSNYTQAEQILKELETCDYRCLLSDVSVSCRCNDLTKAYDTAYDPTTEEEVASYVNLVSVSAVATFYETVVGGTSDAGLPAE